MVCVNANELIWRSTTEDITKEKTVRWFERSKTSITSMFNLFNYELVMTFNNGLQDIRRIYIDLYDIWL